MPHRSYCCHHHDHRRDRAFHADTGRDLLYISFRALKVCNGPKKVRTDKYADDGKRTACCEIGS